MMPVCAGRRARNLILAHPPRAATPPTRPQAPPGGLKGEIEGVEPELFGRSGHWHPHPAARERRGSERVAPPVRVRRAAIQARWVCANRQEVLDRLQPARPVPVVGVRRVVRGSAPRRIWPGNRHRVQRGVRYRSPKNRGGCPRWRRCRRVEIVRDPGEKEAPGRSRESRPTAAASGRRAGSAAGGVRVVDVAIHDM